MAFTEFYVQTTGSNLNAGSTNTDAASLTYASGTWVASTGVFTVASGNPTSDGVAVGDFASVYPDGSTVGVFVGRVTARSSTTITVSLTAKSGTAPTDGTNTRTLKIGGAWKGPNAAEAFPFGFVAATQTNSSGDVPRVNFKSGTNYAITAAMTHSIAGPVAFQGYTTTPGDLGRIVIDGGTSGASYALLTLTGGECFFADFILQNNGATGNNVAFTVNVSGGNLITRFVVTSMRGIGFQLAGGNGIASIATDFECYGCNQSTASAHAVQLQSSCVAVRGIAHDNASAAGFGVTFGAILINCISESNGLDGLTFSAGTATGLTVIGCDFYNNGRDGIRVTATTLCSVNLQNCNFIKNAGWGYNRTGSTIPVGLIQNCGFGAGTQANSSGTTAGLGAVVESGSITYASNVTPWVDPANGDFRISLAAAKGAGRGVFTQTAASYAGTIAYPDIGAAQHRELERSSFSA